MPPRHPKAPLRAFFKRRNLCDIEQLARTRRRHFVEHFAKEHGPFGVEVVIGNHHAARRVDAIAFVDIRKHHMKERGKRQRKQNDPYEHVALPYKHAHGVRE